MRVLVVVEQLRRSVPGGVGTYARGLVQGLVAAGGADATLFASRPPGRGAGDPLAGLPLPLVTSRLPGPLLTRMWDRGIGLVPAGHDVVHATSLAAPPGGRTPCVVTVHDLAWRRVPEAFPARGQRWHEAALRRALAGAAALVAPSEETAAALGDAGARRVEVVPEGCDHLAPPDPAAAAALLAPLGVAGPYLLSVGTREPRKNLPRVMRAYSRARARLPEPWPLVVVGPPGWGGPVDPVPGVVLAGRVGDGVLSALYAGARCLVYAPLLEGFGLPAVEAMRSGTPVVASPMPSTGGAALEVDPYDEEAMAAAMLVAAADEGVRSELCRRGAARAAALTWEAAARRHVDIWASLC